MIEPTQDEMDLLIPDFLRWWKKFSEENYTNIYDICHAINHDVNASENIVRLVKISYIAGRLGQRYYPKHYSSIADHYQADIREATTFIAHTALAKPEVFDVIRDACNGSELVYDGLHMLMIGGYLSGLREEFSSYGTTVH